MSLMQIPSEIMPIKNLSGGQWKMAQGREVQVVSPYNGQVIGTFKASSSLEVDETVSAAREAQGAWEATPLKERCQVLYRFREILMRDLESFSLCVARESGKTQTSARTLFTINRKTIGA